MRATPPEISTVSEPVSASRSPLGKVTKQPFWQNSTVSPPASARSVLLPPPVTISVRVSASLLTALAEWAEPLTASKATAATRDFHICNIGVPTASVALRKAFSPLHGSLYEMEAEPQLNAAFMPQLASACRLPV